MIFDKAWTEPSGKSSKLSAFNILPCSQRPGLYIHWIPGLQRARKWPEIATVIVPASIRGGPDDTWGGAIYVFFPLCKLFFSLLTRKKTFPLRQRNNFFPNITPFFCQFCERTFYFVGRRGSVVACATYSTSDRSPVRSLAGLNYAPTLCS